VVDVTSTVGEAGVRVREGRLDQSYPHACRPVLWPHRETGEEILAVWEQQTDAILPLAPDESTALLEALFEHLYQPAHRYQHEWHTGDLVLWDNHAVQHARPEVGTEEPRTLRRVCIGDTQDLSVFARYVRK
jgi:taurine dioxygenase